MQRNTVILSWFPLAQKLDNLVYKRELLQGVAMSRVGKAHTVHFVILSEVLCYCHSMHKLAEWLKAPHLGTTIADYVIFHRGQVTCSLCSSRTSGHP